MNRSWARKAGPWLLLGLAVVAVALATGRRGGDGDPLDPRSAGPLGARALVLVLEELGATVDIGNGTPGPDARTAILLADQLDDARREELASWVRSGGVLVVADPGSPLAPPAEGQPRPILPNGSKVELAPACPLPALAEVGKVEPGNAVALARPDGAAGCFPRGEGFFLVARAEGRGTVVVLGGAAAFLNNAIGRADNAVLAVSLLAPEAGTRVAFLERPPAGSGEKGLGDLVPRRVKDGLWQLLVAFGLFALWRARRLGRPVLEPQPVQVAGSELVVAVGNLLQRAKRRDQAAAMLRGELRRVLADRLGLVPDAPAELVVATAASRTATSADSIARALDPRPLAGEAELVALARSVDAIRQEVAHVRQ